ncbi:sugar ABC transporter permease, partial [Rhizobium leguminosarum]
FSYRFGYGAAIASVLFVIMAAFIVLYLSRIIHTEERGG